MSAVVAERKYAMTRIAEGDYLLPSNDGQTLWRIYRYREEGSLSYAKPGGGYREVRGMFWACARQPFPPSGTIEWDDLGGWEGWEFHAGPFNTRQQAIDEALR